MKTQVCDQNTEKNYRRLAFSILVVALGCMMVGIVDARAIRFDNEEAGGNWEERDTAATASIGFDFSLFGSAATSELTINANGSVELGNGAIVQLFDYDPHFQPLQFDWTTTTSSWASFYGAGTAGFRIEWFSDPSSNDPAVNFQLALFMLNDGRFVMEFNYDRIDDGAGLSDMFIGYDNGSDQSFNLLESFPSLELFGNNDNCLDNPNALACNNDIPAELGSYFQNEFQDNGEPAEGRYSFLLPGPTAIPEPGSLILLLAGIACMGASRRWML